MKPSHDIWNILHDGSIVETIGACPGRVSLKVEIQYLCDVISEGASFLWVHLHRCCKATYTPYDPPGPISDLRSFHELDLIILTATEMDAGVSVCCTGGTLDLTYADARYELEGGDALCFAAISGACEKYWDKWKRSNSTDA